MSKARNLAGFAASISADNNLNVGIITATSFSGSGSGLSGVTTNFVTAIGIQSAGTAIGTGITSINFVGSNITATPSGATINVSVAIPAGFNELDAALFN